MIGRLTGRVEMDETGWLLVDVGGVGYQLRAPASTAKQLRPGEVATLRVHMVFSQEQLALYGFATSEELRMFQLLLKVNRVGPTLALSVLGTLGAAGLARALVTNDVDTLTSVDGVGKKTAQRLLLELREKLTEVENLGGQQALVLPARSEGPPDERSDALEALSALGYNRGQANTALDQVVRQLGKGASVQQLITAALALLSRPF